MADQGNSSPFGFAFGARYMLDAAMKFNGQGIPTFIRMQNVVEDPQSDWADVGFVLTVSGSLSASGGYVDYQIIPQPLTEEPPSHRRGLPETQVQVGPVHFTISHTWVLSQMALFGFSNPLSVFRDERVIGIVYGSEILTIESIEPEYIGAQVINWNVVGVNADLSVTG